jgi:hypothetical protein
VVSNWHDLDLGMEMVHMRCLVAARNKLLGSIMNKLETADVCWFAIWKPNWCSIVYTGFYKSFEGKQGRFAVMAPGCAIESTHDSEPLGGLGTNFNDVVAKTEGDPKHFGVMAEWNCQFLSMVTAGRSLTCLVKGVNKVTCDLVGAIECLFRRAHSTTESILDCSF